MCDIQEKVKAVMDHYRRIIRRREGYEFRWEKGRRRFNITNANRFFIGHMLDQGGRTEPAWDRAKHFVENHFKDGNFWQNISEVDYAELKDVCQYGYNGNSYAVYRIFNKFPNWLRINARKMIDEYRSDPRNIWNNAEVDEIRQRFESFSGIGPALSRMATNNLVRGKGVAGGRQDKSQLFLKPDVLLRRVMYRVGFVENNGVGAILKAEQIMKQDNILRSPADFDAATWAIGRYYCHENNPDCENCPIRYVCDQNGL